MLQYTVLLILWSISSRLQSIHCVSPTDLNLVVYIILGAVDSLSYTMKAFRTLSAEYFILSGKRHTDVFLYCWSFLQLAYKCFVWVSLGLLVHVSPIRCLQLELLACVFIVLAICIRLKSPSIRKWYISKQYEHVPTEIPTEDDV